MSNEFEYNAPRFVDFKDGLDHSDGADTFFDVEGTPPKEDKENRMESINQENIKPETSTAEANIKAVNSENSVKNRGQRKAFRRLSANNENDLLNAEVKPLSKETDKLSYDLKELSVKAKRRTHFEGIPITIIEEKQHPMVTRKEAAEKTQSFELRSRAVHKEQAGRNLKRKSMFAESVVPAMKYQAMAEQVFHFQRDTPPRFHTSSRRSIENHKQLLKSRLSYKPRRTNAFTPKLMTAMRSRPEPVPPLSYEERENLEMEEMKKYQLKALPLDEKVLLPPRPLRKSLRPPLVPEPFNLTHIFKKPAPKVEGELYKFTAKPVPRTILKRCVGVGQKLELPVTVPQSPAITKSMRHQRPVRVSALSNDNEEKEEDLASCGVPIREPAVGPKKTQIEPFSFEPRDKEMLERKQKKIQEIYEAERKAREFKAKPVPACVASRDSSRVSHMDTSTQTESPVITSKYHPGARENRSPSPKERNNRQYQENHKTEESKRSTESHKASMSSFRQSNQFPKPYVNRSFNNSLNQKADQSFKQQANNNRSLNQSSNHQNSQLTTQQTHQVNRLSKCQVNQSSNQPHNQKAKNDQSSKSQRYFLNQFSKPVTTHSSNQKKYHSFKPQGYKPPKPQINQIPTQLTSQIDQSSKPQVNQSSNKPHNQKTNHQANRYSTQQANQTSTLQISHSSNQQANLSSNHQASQCSNQQSNLSHSSTNLQVNKFSNPQITLIPIQLTGQVNQSSKPQVNQSSNQVSYNQTNHHINQIPTQMTNQSSNLQVNRSSNQFPNQQANQHTNQSSNKQVNLSYDQQIKRQTNQQASHSHNLQINHSPNHHTNKFSNHLANQSTNQQTNQFSKKQINQTSDQKANHQTNQQVSHSSNLQNNHLPNQQVSQSYNYSSSHHTNQQTNQQFKRPTNLLPKQSVNQVVSQQTNQPSNEQANPSRIQQANQSLNHQTNQVQSQQANQSFIQQDNQSTKPQINLRKLNSLLSPNSQGFFSCNQTNTLSDKLNVTQSLNSFPEQMDCLATKTQTSRTCKTQVNGTRKTQVKKNSSSQGKKTFKTQVKRTTKMPIKRISKVQTKRTLKHQTKKNPKSQTNNHQASQTTMQSQTQPNSDNLLSTNFPSQVQLNQQSPTNHNQSFQNLLANLIQQASENHVQSSIINNTPLSIVNQNLTLPINQKLTSQINLHNSSQVNNIATDEELALMEVLKCQDCRCWMSSDEVFSCMCKIVCSQCVLSDTCSVCHLPFTADVNVAQLHSRLSAVIPHPCRHQGCPLHIRPGQDHEDTCQYRPLICFVCDQNVPTLQIKEHLENNHPQRILIGGANQNIELSDFHTDRRNGSKLITCITRGLMLWFKLIKSDDQSDAEFVIQSINCENEFNVNVTFEFRFKNYYSCVRQSKELSIVKVPTDVITDWRQRDCTLDLFIKIKRKRTRT